MDHPGLSPFGESPKKQTAPNPSFDLLAVQSLPFVAHSQGSLPMCPACHHHLGSAHSRLKWTPKNCDRVDETPFGNHTGVGPRSDHFKNPLSCSDWQSDLPASPIEKPSPRKPSPAAKQVFFHLAVGGFLVVQLNGQAQEGMKSMKSQTAMMELGSILGSSSWVSMKCP